MTMIETRESGRVVTVKEIPSVLAIDNKMREFITKLYSLRLSSLSMKYDNRLNDNPTDAYAKRVNQHAKAGRDYLNSLENITLDGVWAKQSSDGKFDDVDGFYNCPIDRMIDFERGELDEVIVISDNEVIFTKVWKSRSNGLTYSEEPRVFRLISFTELINHYRQLFEEAVEIATKATYMNSVVLPS